MVTYNLIYQQLSGQILQIKFNSRFDPLFKGTQSTSRNHNTFRFSGGRVNQRPLLHIRILTPFGFIISVTNIVRGIRPLSRY